MNRISKGLLIVALLSGSMAARASVLDQNNPVGSVGLSDSLEWQQQVTDGIAGVLAGVTLYTNTVSDLDTVSIGVGSAFTTGPFAFTTTATLTPTGTFIDTSAANIHLTAGEHFVIDVSGGPAVGNLAGNAAAYSGGDLFLNLGGPIDYTTAYGYSMAFQTNMTPVPLPAAAWLLLSGLGGLGLLGRKHKV
jgi:hypothetical protein